MSNPHAETLGFTKTRRWKKSMDQLRYFEQESRAIEFMPIGFTEDRFSSKHADIRKLLRKYAVKHMVCPTCKQIHVFRCPHTHEYEKHCHNEECGKVPLRYLTAKEIMFMQDRRRRERIKKPTGLVHLSSHDDEEYFYVCCHPMGGHGRDFYPRQNLTSKPEKVTCPKCQEFIARYQKEIKSYIARGKNSGLRTFINDHMLVSEIPIPQRNLPLFEEFNEYGFNLWVYQDFFDSVVLGNTKKGWC